MSSKKRRFQAVGKSDRVRKKKGVAPTYSPASFSCGKRERALLGHLVGLGNSRFNVSGYSKAHAIPRSTIYDILNKLIQKGLVTKPYPARFEITKGGQALLEVEKGGVGELRRGCRAGQLSSHYQKYKMEITDRSKFEESYLDSLGCTKKKVENPNLTTHYLGFEDATVVITPKKVIVRLHDIITDDMESSYVESLTKASYYFDLVTDLGIEGNTIVLDDGHYARVDSFLADYLLKIDGKYKLELKNGKWFWIDHSTGKVEDETDDAEARENLDHNMKQLLEGKFEFSEIKEMKELVALMVKLAVEINGKRLCEEHLRIQKGTSETS